MDELKSMIFNFECSEEFVFILNYFMFKKLCALFIVLWCEIKHSKRKLNLGQIKSANLKPQKMVNYLLLKTRHVNQFTGFQSLVIDFSSTFFIPRQSIQLNLTFLVTTEIFFLFCPKHKS